MNLKNQKRAPIYEALERFRRQHVVPFDVPGHKRGRGNPELVDFLGQRCVGIDVNSMKPLDNLCHPVSIIKEAEELAADAFGAAHSFLMVGGTTSAVQAMVLSCCKAGDKIILPRNVHKSAINALVLCGAVPVYIDPKVDVKLGIPLGMEMADVEKAMKENPDAKAVLINNPTYYGICSDLRSLVKLAHEHQMLALVDEARMVVAGDEPQGLFSLGSLESTAAVRISPTLAHFNQRYPKIHLALSTGPSGTMIDGVLEGNLSAAFVDGPLVHPGLEGLPVFPEEMMIVAPFGHPPIARASEVNGASVYAFRANCSYRRHFESWFHADRATPGRIHEMESYHGMLACVIAGAGLALIPRSMLESMPGHQQVSAWPLAEEWRWLTTWLVWRRGAKTRQLEAFIALLNEDRQAAASP